jgi:hypothetical protein
VLEEGAHAAASAKDPAAAWEATLEQVGLGESVRGQLRGSDMRTLLAGGPRVGEASAGFL